MVKFNSRLKPKSRTEVELIKQHVKARQEQLKAAVHSLDNNCRGNSAAKSGLFPLIKDRRTIDKQLGGEKEIRGEKEYCKYFS